MAGTEISPLVDKLIKAETDETIYTETIAKTNSGPAKSR